MTRRQWVNSHSLGKSYTYHIKGGIHVMGVVDWSATRNGSSAAAHPEITALGLDIQLYRCETKPRTRGITASGCTGALRASHFEVKAIQTFSWEGWQSTTIIASASFMLLCFTFP
jgi:hypothetical protein